MSTFKRNKLKQQLKSGNPALGVEFMSESHKFIEVVGWSGFDYIQFDMEHTPYGFADIEAFVRTADGVGLTSLVRVAKVTPPDIRRALETGAQGIILPQVKNADEINDAIEAMHYAPRGSRGMCPITRAARYSEAAWQDYLQWVEQELIVIPLIENQSALDNIDEICEVPGVDALFVGAGDLGQSLGVGAIGLQSPIVQEAVERVADAARRYDIPLFAMPAMHENPFESVEALLGRGARLITFDADILMFSRACQWAVEGSREVFHRNAMSSTMPSTV
ncbi:HpcH/HpaI aldolase family protein [Arthrobacter sp. USHLN218]|uniref:HpcH/HpaI aldolase family protein n=1 Tax=Arthrobacter sp. USHLN218 TaxID=3081232 RepID=UPI00301B1517